MHGAIRSHDHASPNSPNQRGAGCPILHRQQKRKTSLMTIEGTKPNTSRIKPDPVGANVSRSTAARRKKGRASSLHYHAALPYAATVGPNAIRICRFVR